MRGERAKGQLTHRRSANRFCSAALFCALSALVFLATAFIVIWYSPITALVALSSAPANPAAAPHATTKVRSLPARKAGRAGVGRTLDILELLRGEVVELALHLGELVLLDA